MEIEQQIAEENKRASESKLPTRREESMTEEEYESYRKYVSRMLKSMERNHPSGATQKLKEGKIYKELLQEEMEKKSIKLVLNKGKTKGIK